MHDYHMHYHICHHAEGELHEYVERAIELGLQEIGFSEHIPIPGLDDPTGRMAPHEFEKYIRDVTDAQNNYSEIDIRFGIEADYLPPFMDVIEKFLAEYPFDYVIGSVHFVGDWDFSNPDFSFVQLQTNLVARWEYIPGSELFLVWARGSVGSAEVQNDLVDSVLLEKL